jgi:VanZ family protein
MKMQIDMKKVPTIDKFYHVLIEFVITFLITYILTIVGVEYATDIAILTGIVLGVGKEHYDETHGGIFDVYDLMADFIGIAIGCTLGCLL